MLEFMCSKFKYRVGQFDHLRKKKSFSSEFSEAKNQKLKKMYLRGALNSAQFFHHMKKVTI
jgi:hypothetical protein